MLSDRYWLLKVAVALGTLAALCAASKKDFTRKLSDLEFSTLPLEMSQGKAFYFWAHRVVSRQEDGFEVQTRVGPCRVLAPHPLPDLGEYVSVRGSIIGYRLVRADRIQINEGFRWKRALNYAVSGATVLVFLWLVRKRFRGRLRDGLLVGRY